MAAMAIIHVQCIYSMQHDIFRMCNMYISQVKRLMGADISNDLTL
jgi:hypothetical protein